MYQRVVRDLEYQEIPEELGERTYICQNVKPLGHSIFEVQLPQHLGNKKLAVQLPQKWKKRVLFGREDLCIAQFPENFLETPEDDVLGTIQMLLTKKNVKELIQSGQMKELGFEFTFIDKQEKEESENSNKAERDEEFDELEGDDQKQDVININHHQLLLNLDSDSSPSYY